jgi:hypothetical protein
MGLNKSLTIDQVLLWIFKKLNSNIFLNNFFILKACPYLINVSSELENFELFLGEIYKLKSAEPFINQIIETKVKRTKLNIV